MSILPSLSKAQTMLIPDMELINLYYWPNSRSHPGESISCDVYVSGLGKVELKGITLSTETKNAIRADCLRAMQQRLGL